MPQIIHLEQYRIIEIIGTDTEKYLQGQLTCDVTKLQEGGSTLCAHCDPKGKMNSVFRLIRLSSERFYLFIHASLLPDAVEQLKKYAVFSKVTFNAINAQLVGLIHHSSQADMPAEIQLAIGERTLLINPQSAVHFNADFSHWDQYDIQQGYPILTGKTRNEFIPQAVNLQCLEHAVSFQKGCYIGQETVARAKYRGANKRAMYTFTAQTDIIPEIGSELEMQLDSGWRKTGTILYAVGFNGVLWLQVVMSNDLSREVCFRLPNSEILLKKQDLPYSLT